MQQQQKPQRRVAEPLLSRKRPHATDVYSILLPGKRTLPVRRTTLHASDVFSILSRQQVTVTKPLSMTWGQWGLQKATGALSMVARGATVLAVSQMVGASGLGGVSGVLAGAAVSTVTNRAIDVAVGTSWGLLRRLRGKHPSQPPGATEVQSYVPSTQEEAKKIGDNSDELAVRVLKRFTRFLPISYATSATSAIANAALMGIVNPVYWPTMFRWGTKATIAYVNGDVAGFAMDSMKELAQSQWAQGVAVQWVAQNVGWGRVLGTVGTKIQEFLAENTRLGRPVLTDAQRTWVTEQLVSGGYATDWVDTTWADIVAGGAVQITDAAGMYVARELGSRAARETLSAYERAGGASGLGQMILEAHQRAYSAAANALTTVAATEVTSVISHGVRVAGEYFYGGTKKDGVAVRVDRVRRAANRVKAHEARQMVFAIEFQQQLATEFEQLLRDPVAVAEMARDIGEKHKGALEMALKATRGVRFQPIGGKVAGAVAGVMPELTDATLSKIASEMGKNAIMDAATENYGVSLLKGAARGALEGVGAATLDAADMLRNAAMVGANLANLAAETQTAPDSFLSRTTRTLADAIAYLPSAVQMKQALYERVALGAGGRIAEVDLHDVVSRFIVDVTLRGKSSGEAAASVTDSIAWGSNIPEAEQIAIRIGIRTRLEVALGGLGK